jgi:hypothetical protein
MAGLYPSRLKWVVCFWAVSVPFQGRAAATDGTGMPRRGMGISSMSEAHSGSLLIEYFKAFVSDRDLDAFRNLVSARYNEGTLGRILSASNDATARRAAVLSLGIMGAGRRRLRCACHGGRRSLGHLVSRRYPRA